MVTIRTFNIVGHYIVGRNGIITNKDTNRILKLEKLRNGYERVTLSMNGRTKRYSVHRLVAMLYIPNPLNKKFINHINGIKDDNRVENLEWCTESENMLHSYHTLKKGFYISNDKRKRPVSATKNNETIHFDYMALGARHILKELGRKQNRRNIKNIVGMISRSCKKDIRTAYGYNWEYFYAI